MRRCIQTFDWYCIFMHSLYLSFHCALCSFLCLSVFAKSCSFKTDAFLVFFFYKHTYQRPNCQIEFKVDRCCFSNLTQLSGQLCNHEYINSVLKSSTRRCFHYFVYSLSVFKKHIPLRRKTARHSSYKPSGLLG